MRERRTVTRARATTCCTTLCVQLLGFPGKLSAQCSAISAEVDSWRVTQKVADCRDAPANELSFALDPCSDSLLLGVSAVELDALPGLISGSPIFLFFKFASGSSTIS